MVKAPICRSVDGRVAAGLAVLGVAVTLAGCESSLPNPPSGAAANVADLPSPGGSLPDVTVTLAPSTRGSAESSGRAWYVTAVKDPARGNYTAALERRSVSPLWFDTPTDSEQRATIVVVLRNGRPADLMLSVDHGKFVCRSRESDSSCALRVSVDGKLLHPVWFAVPRHWPPSHLHLVAGGDASRLLAALSKAKQLRVQPTFEEEGSPEIEFALTGLNRAIGRVVRRSTTLTPKLAAAGPGG